MSELIYLGQFSSKGYRANACINGMETQDKEVVPVSRHNNKLSVDQVRAVETLKPLMDEKNREAMNVMTDQGKKEAVKHMMTRPDGTIRSYAEMRMLYG